MSGICVDIRPPDLTIAAEWQELAQRGPANVFMNPAALHAVHATNFAKLHVLLAWDGKAEPRRLVGLWALQEQKIVPFWPAFLAAPPYSYAFVSDPVVDPAVMDDVISAFFDAIENDRRLPNVIRIKYLDGESQQHGAITKALAARGGQSLTLATRERPVLSRAFGIKRSGSTRKKLRQDWNRLAARGVVDIVNARDSASVREAFEIFLSLEEASWKGGRGTALLSQGDDAKFARQLIWNLSEQRSASVAFLRIDGQPVAAQVLLYCGNTAYTWKTAFDIEYAKYSPGALLVDKVTDELLSTTNIQTVESCSPEGGFMAQLWEGHRQTVDLLLDVGAGRSLKFAMAAIGENGYARLRSLRNTWRAKAQSLHQKNAQAA